MQIAKKVEEYTGSGFERLLLAVVDEQF